MLDVQRSVHNMPGVDSDKLTNVLKAFAAFNREIEYVQGMCFIAGFLMMIYEDEASTFLILQALMQKF